MFILSRRHFLASTVTAFVGVAIVMKVSGPMAIAAEPDATVLRIDSRTIDVNRKPAKVRPAATRRARDRQGRKAVSGPARERTRRADPDPLARPDAAIRTGWRAGPATAVAAAGQVYEYGFPLETPGTHWMHAHTLQEQQLLAAPLIVTDPAEAGLDEQPVVVLFHDFSFKSPEELLARLTGLGDGMAGHEGMAGHGTMAGHARCPESHAAMPMDVNDIEYDAYLANDRTLDDPQVFAVERNGRVRLRLINGATATAFWIDIGSLDGEAIAVDGNPICSRHGPPLPARNGAAHRHPATHSRRGGSLADPSVARRRGRAHGFRAGHARRSDQAHRSGRPTRRRRHSTSLSSPALPPSSPGGASQSDQREAIVLGGDMAGYPGPSTARPGVATSRSMVRRGDRVEVSMRNHSMMGHPMHLHGHHFQVVAHRRPAFRRSRPGHRLGAAHARGHDRVRRVNPGPGHSIATTSTTWRPG